MRPGERRRGLEISSWEGVSAQVQSSFTGLNIGGNAISTGFALWLGADDRWLGVCSAAPPLMAAAQLLSAQLLPRLQSRRRAVAWAATVGRLLWLLCAALALWPVPWGLPVYVALWLLGSGLLAFSGNLWVSWMADLAPARVRAKYFANRSALLTATGIVAGLGAGLLVDAAGEEKGGAFAALFLVASVAGIACAWLLHRQPEPQRMARPAEPLSLVRPFREALAVPGLRGVLVFVALFGLTNGLALPFWDPFRLEELKLPYSVVNGWLVAIQGTAAVLALPWWGRVAQTLGHRRVIVVCVAIISTHPAYYLLATASSPWLVYVDSVSAGIAWSGYNVAIFNLVLALARGQRLEQHFAVYATVAGLAQALSSVVAGMTVHQLPQHFTVGVTVLHARQAIFLVTGLARVACVVLFVILVKDVKPAPWRAVLAVFPVAVKARMEGFGFIFRGRGGR